MESRDLCDEVLVTLRRITRAIDLQSRKLEQRYGLTGAQLLLLKEISEAGELAIGELARRANVSQANTTAIVDRLQGRGLVERARSQTDKRKVMVRASAEGEARVRDLPNLLQDEFVARFRQSEDWEQTLILSILQRVARMMDAEAIDAVPLLSGDALVEESGAGERGEAAPGSPAP